MDNLRQEFSKNQEMKENIKKFRDEAKRLEESDALQQARRKYVRTYHLVFCPLSTSTMIIFYCGDMHTSFILFPSLEIYRGGDSEDFRGV